MFEFAPDYSSYSTTELLNSLSLVDRERFAGRLADIRSELARRGVRYEETREMDGDKPRYKVKLLKTVPSENLSKQWQQTSHDVEIGEDEENPTDHLGDATYWLFGLAGLWWFSGWNDNFHPSLLTKSLMLVFIGFFVFMLMPKVLQRNNEDLAAQARKTLVLIVAIGISVVPFSLAQLHQVIAASAKPNATVLEIYNGNRWGCNERVLFEINDGRMVEVCGVPSYILDRVRPNDQVQIQQLTSVFGVTVASNEIAVRAR